MDCTEARESLELLALDGLDPPVRAGVEAHLAQCSPCRAVADDYHELVRSIHGAGETHGGPRHGFVQAVRFSAHARIASLRRQRRMRRIVGAAGSLAAAIAVVLAVWTVASEPSPDGRADDRTAADRPEEASRKLAPVETYDGSRSSTASEADGIVVVGQTVYMRRDEAKGANVAAIDTATGRSRWQGRFAVRGYLAADRHRVYCLADGAGGTLDLVALNADDGAELWRFARDRPRRMEAPGRPVALARGRICWAAHRTIYCLDAASGRVVWTRALPDEGALSSLVADRRGLYVATRRALRCLDRDRGAERWARPLPEQRGGRGKPLVALADGRAYIVRPAPGGAGELLAVRLDTHKVLWQQRVAHTRSLLAGPHGVYTRGKTIVAFDSQRGRRLWSRPATGCGPLTLIDGRIHFVDMSDAGGLIALDPATGSPAWQVAGVRSCDTVTRIGPAGYIKTRDGDLRTIALAGRGNS